MNRSASAKPMLEDDKPRLGLRERKKVKTRATIQEQAMRLFREQGYDQTTVEQIAEAAEVSPSTFFRYFPTKEDVVIYDALDPPMINAYRAQPAELSPIQAMRAAAREVFGNLDPEQMAVVKERGMLIFSVPELRAAAVTQFLDSGRLMAELVAERVGRSVDDFAVRTYAGAITGAVLGAFLPAVLDADADFYALMDESLAFIEAGMPL